MQTKMILTDKEQKLVSELVLYLRKIPYGQATFTVYQKNAQPIRLEIEKPKESIMIE